MANSMFGWFSKEDPCRHFSSNEQLFAGLVRREAAAIVCVQDKAFGSVRNIVKKTGLLPEMVVEVLNRSTVIFLQKIADGSYQFQGKAPVTFLVEIARNVALTARRGAKKPADTLDNHLHIPDADIVDKDRRQEAADLVRLLLAGLGEPCGQIIRLQHIDGMSDEEVVHQKLTKYSTPDSLKMKRRDCMKKLTQLAQQWKISNNM